MRTLAAALKLGDLIATAAAQHNENQPLRLPCTVLHATLASPSVLTDFGDDGCRSRRVSFCNRSRGSAKPRAVAADWPVSGTMALPAALDPTYLAGVTVHRLLMSCRSGAALAPTCTIDLVTHTFHRESSSSINMDCTLRTFIFGSVYRIALCFWYVQLRSCCATALPLLL